MSLLKLPLMVMNLLVMIPRGFNISLISLEGLLKFLIIVTTILV